MSQRTFTHFKSQNHPGFLSLRNSTVKSYEQQQKKNQKTHNFSQKYQNNVFYIIYTPTGSMSEFMYLTPEERQLISHSRFMLELVPNNSALMGTY